VSDRRTNDEGVVLDYPDAGSSLESVAPAPADDERPYDINLDVELQRQIREELARRDEERSRARGPTESKKEISAKREAAWPEPVNFLHELAAPPFARDDVPGEIGDFAFAYAEQSGFDPTITVLAAVVAASAALSDDFKLVADSGTGWMQSARLWGLTIAPSGAGKTPAHSAMLHPLHDMQRDLYAEFKRNVESLADDEQKPPRPRIVIADATIEALSEVLRDNPRGILVANDEFESFLGSLDQYKRGAASRDRGEWLRLFDGGPHTVERVQRGSVYVPNFGASLLTATTPTALAKVAKLLPEDGLLQRFLIGIGRRQIDGVRVANVQMLGENFAQLLRRLYDAKPGLHKGVVPMMEMTRDAFDDWRRAQRATQEAFDGIDPSLGAHLAKYPTFALRVALIFHACRIVSKSDEADRNDLAKWPLLPETLKIAVRFLDSARKHAVVLYLALRGGTSDTYVLTRDIARTVLAIGGETVERRDILRQCRAFKNASEREQARALDLLIDLGWLRALTTGYKKPHPTRFTVNPALAAKFASMARQERERRAVVRDEIRGLAHDKP
jgi:hypothetical protein